MPLMRGRWSIEFIGSGGRATASTRGVAFDATFRYNGWSQSPLELQGTDRGPFLIEVMATALELLQLPQRQAGDGLQIGLRVEARDGEDPCGENGRIVLNPGPDGESKNPQCQHERCRPDERDPLHFMSAKTYDELEPKSSARLALRGERCA